jgi:2-dehydro-3-deoxygluconokinase
MPKRVVTFGEIMLRLSPPEYQRFVQADTFEVVYGGGEANVAVSLANFGLDAAYVTKLPDNPIGDAAVNELRRYGVDTRFIARGGDRIGIYYCEKGASVRPSKVVYDRAHSSIAEAKPGDIDWRGAFEGAEWFHFTGITPALGDNVAELTEEACKIAKEMGLTISCDLNYRKKLWSTEKAGKVMGKLMEYVDIVVANEEDAEKVFGIKAADTDVTTGELDLAGYKYVANQQIYAPQILYSLSCNSLRYVCPFQAGLVIETFSPHGFYFCRQGLCFFLLRVIGYSYIITCLCQYPCNSSANTPASSRHKRLFY